MRRTPAIVALALIALVVVFGPAGAAHAFLAQEPGPGQGPSQSQIDECIGTAPILGMPPTCTYDANGNLISRSSSDFGDSSSSMPNLAPFLFIALLWSVVPFVIAISLAKSRGEPVSTAVLLTLVLGWVGLVIVGYGQRRVAGDVGRLVQPQSPPATPPPAPPPAAASSASASERLRTIDELHAQGLITDEERAQRRAAILDEL